MDDLDDLSELAQDWYRYLRVANIAPSTVRQYRTAVENLLVWTGPTTAAGVTDRKLARYFDDISQRPSKRRPGHNVSSSWVSLQYRSLQQFFKWLTEVENEIKLDPFHKLKSPKIPEQPVPVFSDDDLRRLLSSCSGSEFADRRDTAIVRFLLDTGVRVSELVGMQLDNLDFERGSVTVYGKGRKFRQVSVGNKTTEAVRRYLRARKRHSRATSDAVWLGEQGALTHWGVRQIMDRRGARAGVKPCNPHRFRHTFAHRWLADGNGETDLMRLAGWSTRQMLTRYGSSAASERAITAHQRAALGDRV